MNPLLLAQAVTTDSPTVNWLYQFTNNLSNLTTQNGNALSQLGMAELSFISMLMLVKMVIQWNTSTMTLSLHRQSINVGDLVSFLLRLIGCALLESYWVMPVPGASFGFNHLFSYFAQAIVAALDQSSLNTLTNLLHTAGANTPMPSAFALPEVICYYIVQGLLGLASGILFLINCSSFIFYGVSALFGPIFIPLYMTQMFRGKFTHFVDVLLSFAMIRAVAAAFIFVWAGFLNGFIQQTFDGNYSIAMWEANLIPCSMVFVAFVLNMVFIPSLTQTLFGGGASIAGRLGEVAERIVLATAAR